jgi:3-oxoadipate enol-lactonase / 4-carboxymuconolactone decarboxylase
MPFAQADGARIFWRCDGHDGHPALLLANSIGCDHALWDPVVPALARQFRVIRYDMRGHGASDAPQAEYSMERLAKDALAVADAAGAKRFHFAGISLGGMVGMWLGANAPERIDRLILSNTSPYFGPEAWVSRIALVRSGGMAAVVDMVMGRFFSPAFVERNDERYVTIRRTFLATDPGGYIGCGAAIRDMDQRGSLGRIKSPTLVVAGKRDLATTPEQGQAIAKAIAGAKYVELPCAHLPPPEAPQAYVDAICGFLGAPASGTDKERYERGLARRKEVLGAKYVEERLANRHPFTDEFQALITRYAWGEMWTRPVFDDRTRRLLVLAMLVALKSWEEFELHARMGLERELSETDLKEMLMLVAIYAGVPTANSAFAHARKLIEQ